MVYKAFQERSNTSRLLNTKNQNFILFHLVKEILNFQTSLQIRKTVKIYSAIIIPLFFFFFLPSLNQDWPFKLSVFLIGQRPRAECLEQCEMHHGPFVITDVLRRPILSKEDLQGIFREEHLRIFCQPEGSRMSKDRSTHIVNIMKKPQTLIPRKEQS